MTGSMIAASLGNKKAAREAREIWRKLNGVADPATANKKGMSAEEIKRGMMGLT
jgi:hypothetical protein